MIKCPQVQYLQLDFLPTSPPHSTSRSSSTQNTSQSLTQGPSLGLPGATKGQIQGPPGPRPRPSRGSPPPPIVEPYTNTTISTIMDLDEETVEEHTRANTRLNTKTSSRKEKVLGQEPSTRDTNGFDNSEEGDEEEEAMIRANTRMDIENEQSEDEGLKANTRMDMRRQKDIAALAGIRCSQL